MFGQKAFLAPPTASLRLVCVKILTSKTMLCGFNVKVRLSLNTDRWDKNVTLYPQEGGGRELG